jgi:hypothetical protein
VALILDAASLSKMMTRGMDGIGSKGVAELVAA